MSIRPPPLSTRRQPVRTFLYLLFLNRRPSSLCSSRVVGCERGVPSNLGFFFGLLLHLGALPSSTFFTASLCSRESGLCPPPGTPPSSLQFFPPSFPSVCGQVLPRVRFEEVTTFSFPRFFPAFQSTQLILSLCDTPIAVL